MRRMFDFRCENAHTTEKYIDDAHKSITCPECGYVASRIISPVRVNLDPISGDFPGATMKWVKDREQKMKLETKKADRHGKESLWEGADPASKPKRKITTE